MRKPGALAAAIFIGGAVAFGACGPRIDSAARADIDQRVAAMVPCGVPFPAPASLMPKPIAVGQWTQHKLVSGKGEASLLTYKIVGQEESAFWVEVANETYHGKTVTKLLVGIGDRSNPATIDIRAVKIKDPLGKLTELQGPAVPSTKQSLQSMVNMLAVSWQGLPQENVAVVAGNFAAAYKAMTDASWGVWRAMAVSWMHPAVPLSGLVKSAGMSQAVTVELVGFGDNGATSELP